jgi:hypothetical protein
VIDFDCAAGGISQNTIATQLVFAAGKSGLVITALVGWRVGPFLISSKSTAAGADIGFFAQNGNGAIERATVEYFGSHGVHLKAGTAVGGGNVNSSILNRVRCYGNRGDGIKLEGSEANAILLLKPDVVANYGWGINLEGVSQTNVMQAHADQQYNGAPGAFRENGNSNAWRWVYSEGSVGLTLDAGSSTSLVEVGAYGKPVITDLTAGKSALILDSQKGFYNWLGILGNTATATQFEFTVDQYSPSALAIVHNAGAGGGVKTCAVYQRNVDQWIMFAPVVPDADATRDLGVSGKSWRNLYANGIVRPVTTKTANYTVAVTDNTIITDGATVTITLPDPAVAIVGRAYTVKNINAAAATVASAGTSKLLDGAASQSLAQWAKLTFISDGTQWLTV